MTTEPDLVGATIVTEQGSVYRVWTDNNKDWLLQAIDNKPTKFSQALDPEEAYLIRAPVPWPPEMGLGMALMSSFFYDKSHPCRMPGGGKLTSRVVVVTDCCWDAEAVKLTPHQSTTSL